MKRKSDKGEHSWRKRKDIVHLFLGGNRQALIYSPCAWCYLGC